MGVWIALPSQTEAQIRSRSGLAFKKGIAVLNSPGTIDEDYRGELKVLLMNYSEKDVIIAQGERIAQLVMLSYEQIQWKNVEIMDSTERGTGGFGSTGVKALQCVTGMVVPTPLYIEGIGPETVSDDEMVLQEKRKLGDDVIEMFDDESWR